ncbi:MAG: hypothetical protein DMG65_21345 [Candidatus Angelobacter sp. Gp1-AA117]|nr:MAG: hypothetical protein DMG65_21345 [Candidatus Angelobacter sp. Gp1-AA117]
MRSRAAGPKHSADQIGSPGSNKEIQAGRLHISANENGLTITIPYQRNASDFLAIIVLLGMAGWYLFISSILGVKIAAGMAVLIAAAAVLVFLRSEEVITIANDRLQIHYAAFGLRWRRTFKLRKVINLRFEPIFVSMWASTRRASHLAFTYHFMTRRFASGITAGEASAVLKAINRRIPDFADLSSRPSDAPRIGWSVDDFMDLVE